MKNKKIAVYVLLFAIVTLGLFLRVWNINEAPPGIYPDEAVNGQDALRALETGTFRWFYPDNNGREGLFMNLIALCFKIFGVSILALKLPSIICGTLTILGVFLLAKEIFNNRIGLISSFLCAVSFWPLNLNRIAFRANLLPLILVFSFYFVFRALRTKKISDFAIGGFIFGIGMHTYIAWRIAPLILIFLLVSLILTQRKFLREYWRGLLIFLLLSIISAAPMFWTFYAHPEYLESRSSSISVFSPEMNGGHPIQTLAKSFTLSLVKYNFWGDQNWRHNYPPYPILDPITGLAFLSGLFFCIYQLLKLIRFRINGIKNKTLNIYIFLVSWFFLMLAPEFMTAEGLPHALRSIGTAPVVFLMSALVFEKFLLWPKRESRQKAMLFLVVAALIFIGTFNTVKYHFSWSHKVEAARAFEKVLVDVSDYIKVLPENKEIFVITGSMQRIPIKLFNHTMQNVSYLYSPEIENINPQNKTSIEIIMTERNDEIIKKLRKRFPKMELQEFRDSFGISFYVLK